jgi:hypothetical protein
MTATKKAILLTISSFVLANLTMSYAEAQSPAASAPVGSTTKGEAKAQRKAARKAARAKKNKELGDLEKNGYLPGSNDTQYPQNLQNAESKKSGH